MTCNLHRRSVLTTTHSIVVVIFTLMHRPSTMHTPAFFPGTLTAASPKTLP